MIKLGDRVKDIITSFEGIVTARHDYLNGCTRFTVQPRELKDGKPIDSEWFDVEQLELVETQALGQPESEPSGGPQDTPPKLEMPTL